MFTLRSISSRAAAAALFVAVASCAANSNAGDMATTDKLTEDPMTFVGDTVTIRGDVSDVRGPHAFTVEDSDIIFQDDLLVITAKPFKDVLVDPDGPQIFANDKVEVTGKVVRLVVADVEREYDFDLDPEWSVEFRDRPVLIAYKVDMTAQQ